MADLRVLTKTLFWKEQVPVLSNCYFHRVYLEIFFILHGAQARSKFVHTHLAHFLYYWDNHLADKATIHLNRHIIVVPICAQFYFN